MTALARSALVRGWVPTSLLDGPAVAPPPPALPSDAAIRLEFPEIAKEVENPQKMWERLD